MAELLLINPRRRKSARKSTKTRRRVAHRVSAAPVRRRRRNPIGAVHRRVMRRNPARRMHHRRRRNPISLGSSASWMAMLKDAAIGGAGAVAIDVLMGQINPSLPVSMQVSATSVGMGDAVKAAITIAFGMLLKKPIFKKMAMGALTNQAADIMRTMVPATMPMAGVGYAVPAGVINRSARVGPNRLSAYTSIRSPLLNAYTSGRSPMLSGMSAREREGAVQ